MRRKLGFINVDKEMNKEKGGFLSMLTRDEEGEDVDRR